MDAATTTATDPTPAARPRARACFVVVYFGQWPRWFDYFLRTCGNNPEFHWMIFTDCDRSLDTPSNVILQPFAKADVERIVGERFGPDYRFSYGYKLCDMKPAYGDFFADYLTNYEFWGYVDIDLVYGRLSDFITGDVLDRHDVVTASPGMVVGHGTLLRNTERLRQLYRECPTCRDKFFSKDYDRFDEFDFSDHVRALADAGQLRLFQDRIQLDDAYVTGSGRKRYLITIKDSRARDVFGGRAISYFHFLHSKYRKDFQSAPFGASARTFVVDHHGLYALDCSAHRLRFAREWVLTFALTLPWYAKMALKQLLPQSLRAMVRGK